MSSFLYLGFLKRTLKKKVTLIHTGFALVDVLTKLFKQYIPEAELTHIIDDSLLREVLANEEVTKTVIARKPVTCSST